MEELKSDVDQIHREEYVPSLDNKIIADQVAVNNGDCNSSGTWVARVDDLILCNAYTLKVEADVSDHSVRR